MNQENDGAFVSVSLLRITASTPVPATARGRSSAGSFNDTMAPGTYQVSAARSERARGARLLQTEASQPAGPQRADPRSRKIQ